MEKESQVCMSEPSMGRASMSHGPCSFYTSKCLAETLQNEKKRYKGQCKANEVFKGDVTVPATSAVWVGKVLLISNAS